MLPGITSADRRPSGNHGILLWIVIAVYAAARLCQLYADILPTLLIVVLHVIPPAIFALLHGRIRYGLKGFSVFVISCLGVSAISETLSLKTGVPFGHYYFTSVMGPKCFGLPFLLVLAYLGIAYCSWAISLLILGVADKHLSRYNVILVPLLASIVFVAWDLSMEPDWSTVDRAWIWRDGGPYFGVPASNFVGWFLTAIVFFQIFAIYCWKRPQNLRLVSKTFWYYPILMYAICAAGNLLIPFLPMAPEIVADATGKLWRTHTILLADSTVSVFLMGSFALTAWLRLSGTTPVTGLKLRP